jgi:hypothetical protein
MSTPDFNSHCSPCAEDDQTSARLQWSANPYGAYTVKGSVEESVDCFLEAKPALTHEYTPSMIDVNGIFFVPNQRVIEIYVGGRPTTLSSRKGSPI